MKRHHHALIPWALVIALGAVGCGGDGTLPTAAPEAALPAQGGAGAMFNPQPEPPAQILRFSVTGDLRRMEGRIESGGEGSLIVTGLQLRERDRTLHVVQRWEIHPPDPVVPIIVQLGGIINLTNGRVVLNGRTADGARAHLRGTATFSGSGGISIGGELMFNPQPEPPAL